MIAFERERPWKEDLEFARYDTQAYTIGSSCTQPGRIPTSKSAEVGVIPVVMEKD
jgi:hypothetical protein